MVHAVDDGVWSGEWWKGEDYVLGERAQQEVGGEEKGLLGVTWPLRAQQRRGQPCGVGKSGLPRNTLVPPRSTSQVATSHEANGDFESTQGSCVLTNMYAGKLVFCPGQNWGGE